MKKKILFIVISVIILLIIGISFIILSNNKTFFKTTYIGVNGEKIFIPRYSYFKSECCMTAATFYSLKSRRQLNNEIKQYMNKFIYFENDETYGYKKGNMFIQSYTVEENIFYRKIIITY